MNPQFWKDKTVLMTGHTGFKGGWLSLWLQARGARVIGYALPPPTDPNFFELCGLDKTMESIRADIRDFKKFKSALLKHKPQIVIHMAAQPIVRLSYQNPLETFETNVMGTANVLEAVRQTECVRVALVITSDKCYENREWLWGYREIDPMGGKDPYSSSKGCAELVTAAYNNSFFAGTRRKDSGVAVASARAGNVIGGGDWAQDRLVPDIIKAVAKGQSVEIRYPGAVRPWQFVLEPLDGYLRLIEKLWQDQETYAGAWNFGPSDKSCKPVARILKLMDDLWPGGIKWHSSAADSHPHEANFLRLDCGKAATLLDWYPKLSLERTLEFVVAWYENCFREENMRTLSEHQITEYEHME